MIERQAASQTTGAARGQGKSHHGCTLCEFNFFYVPSGPVQPASFGNPGKSINPVGLYLLWYSKNTTLLQVGIHTKALDLAWIGTVY